MKTPIEELLAAAGEGRLRDAATTVQRALQGIGAPVDADIAVIEAPPRSAQDFGASLAAPLTAKTATDPRFERRTYVGPTGSRDYKLFVPAGAPGRPLVVMLHGCKQDPDDFAAGTRMNELAQAQGFLVLYPAQAPRSNVSKCWNWFMPGDQRRGRGEPALLAGMTRHVIETEGVDPKRVYAAGLSAGAAMAAILGREYPDLYAAVGIHSGLPQGAAHDVASAFSAMKSGAAGAHPAGRILASALHERAAAPVIVFHGDRDQTVHPRNGADVVSALVGPVTPGGIDASDSAAHAAGRDYTRTVYRRQVAAAREPSLAEHWVVHGAGHAWSGGSLRGSYTDSRGPDASREMLRFFAEHPLAG